MTQKMVMTMSWNCLQYTLHKERRHFCQHGVIWETSENASGYGCFSIFDSRVPLSGATEELPSKTICHSPVFIHRRYHTCAGEGPGAGEVWGTRVEVATCGG